MKKLVLPLVTAGIMATSLSAQAAEYEIRVTNLTSGVHFTPLMVAAHDADTDLFTVGEEPSAALELMAETGVLSEITTQLQSAQADIALIEPGRRQPAGAPAVVGPQGSPLFQAYDNFTLTTADDNTQLSIVAMLLPTNDGFVGLDSRTLPTTVGESVTWYLNGYDAGSEYNDELRSDDQGPRAILGDLIDDAGFPLPPFLTGAGSPYVTGNSLPGTNDITPNDDANDEGFVHIHRGVLGDTDPNGGRSDVNARVHRWLNPVARVQITVVSGDNASETDNQ